MRRGYKVAVTASFAEPEKSALNMRCASFDRRHRICNGKPFVVVAMHADFNAPERFYDNPRDFRNFFGKTCSVGIAQNQQSGARVFGRTQTIEGVIGVFFISVKKVFGVEKHGFASVAQKTDTVVNHLKVFL